MAKVIKIDMTSFSDEADANSAMNAMNASMPAGQSATPAQKVTDNNGKLISLIVAVPDNLTSQQHQDVRDAALSASPGVSSATAIPTGGPGQDFESLGAPGTIITSPLQVGEAPLTLDMNISTAATNDMKISAAGEGFGGNGSALVLESSVTSGPLQGSVYQHRNQGGFLLFGFQNGLPSGFSGIEYKCEFNFADKSGAKGDLGHGELFSTAIFGTMTTELNISRNTSGGFYDIYLSHNDGAVSVFATLPYVADQYETMSIKVDAAGNVSASFGSWSSGVLSGVPATYEGMQQQIWITDSQSDTSAITQQGILMDNIETTILSI